MKQEFNRLLEALQKDVELPELHELDENVKDILNKMTTGELDIEEAVQEYHKSKSKT